MPRATWNQNNFNAGEWSPLTYGRSDIAKYKNALATCKNYVPTAQGGLTRRPGTRYVAATKSNAEVRLIRFEFSTTQAYILEFGDQYIRFYLNDGQLQTGAVAAYNGATSYVPGNLVASGGINYYCKANTTGNAPPNATYWYPLSGTIFEVPTPYVAADIWKLQVTQSADVLYIAHPSYAPRKLQRTGAVAWTLSAISFLDGPYLPLNTTTTTFTLSAVGPGAGITVTASAITGINGGAGFSTNDIGRSFRFRSSTNWGWGTFTAYTSTTVMTATIVSAPSAAAASTAWRLGAWSATIGYPGCVTFHQDRLVWAGCTAYPSRIDGSNTGDYENMAPSNVDNTVVDSNALSFSINSNTVNLVQWIVSDEFGLLCGTSGGEWVISPSSQQTALTPTNVNSKNTTSYGTAAVPPQRMGKSLLFVQRTKRKLREMAFSFERNTFTAPDISLIGEHLTTSGIKQMASTQAPQPVAWMVRTDGALVALSYDQDQEITGWHQHEIGGYSDSGQTLAPLVESVASIPDTTIEFDELWIVVKRYINGGTVRYIEVMTEYWEDGMSTEDAVYLDSSAEYSGVSTTTITGLTWLKGQSVSVLTNGAVHPNCTVNGSGEITLQLATTKAQVGLSYESRGKTMRIEAGSADGPAQGKLKRIHKVIFRFFQSIGLDLWSYSQNDFYPLPWRTSDDPMDGPIDLFTGDKDFAYDGTWDRDGQLEWRKNDPLPSNILLIAAHLETQDGG